MLVGCLLASGPAVSQTFPLFDQPEISVGILDQERLFTSSKFGQSFIADFEKRASEVAAENREIEAALEAEELELTRLRSIEDPDNFVVLAEAFNEKANRIRAERRQISQDLVSFRENAQQQFFSQVGPVLIQLMRDYQVAVIIERASVVLSLPNIDLTDEAIRRIDEVFSQ